MPISRQLFILSLLSSVLLLPGLSRADDVGAAIGTVTGAVGGGIIGSQFGGGVGNALATTGGVIAGGIIGNRIGSAFDNSGSSSGATPVRGASALGSSDYDSAGLAGSGVTWQPTYYGTQNVQPYVVQQDVQLEQTAPDPRFCRPYAQTFQIGDSVQQKNGMACLQPDGTWQPVN